METSRKGTFITLEGGEGSGKSTVIAGMKHYFEENGYTVMVTREPGGVPVAEQIRKVILDSDMTPLTEAYLFAAARQEHLQQKVLPALERGEVVICDRFVHSSYAYQGYAGGLGVPFISRLNAPILEQCYPDRTFYLDIDPEIGLARIRENKRETNRMDEQQLAFHQLVREGYLQCMEWDEKMVLIDANQPQEKVLKDLTVQLNALFLAKAIG